MSIVISGTDGITPLKATNGSAGAPSVTGTDTDTGLFFGTNEVNIATGGTERAKVDDSGRLLVGTSSSSENVRAVFQGRSTTDPTGQTVVYMQRGSSGPGVLAGGSGLAEIKFADSDGNLAASIEALADDTWGSGGNDYPGRLVFTTTANGASSPTERMRIESRGIIYGYSTDAGYIQGLSNGAGTTYRFFSGRHTSTGADGSGTESYRVWSNGNVENTNNSYGAISDIKLKENIVDANSQWNDIKDLRVRNYNFIEGQTHTQIGVVAQEVETVSPGLVTESPDRDEEGNDLGTTTKSVNYSVLYMKAVKALQEAMERIETLEAKVAALEGGAS